MQSFLWSLSLVWFFLTVSTPVGIADDHSDSSIGSFYCRSRGKLLEKSNFLLETCYLCYIYMPKIQFKPDKKWRPSKHKPGKGYEVPWLTNGTEESLADSMDNDSYLLNSFAHVEAENLWKDCCNAAQECCEKIKISASKLQQMSQETVSPETKGCPPTWDGWQCWSQGGVAGETQYETCPNYIFFHTGGGNILQNSCGRYAQKYCNESGSWLIIKSRGEWTDFTTCSKVNALLTQEYVHISLYSVSILALIPAIIIFFSYKVLRVPRITIHKNLFASLTLHCVFMITFKSLVLLPYIKNSGDEQNMLKEHSEGCRVLLMFSKYFRLTNYTWMFCEGYYLHRLLVNTFEEKRSLKFIIAIGWIFPIIPCLGYAIARIFVDNEKCWALPAESVNWVEWIYMIPGLFCILANFVFFLNIFRILVTKLKAPHANEPAHFRKAVHATVLLLPLFGLHWLLTLYRPQEGSHCVWEMLYKYLNVVLDGLQGLMVSIAFCYRNGEIRILLKQSLNRFRQILLSSDSVDMGASSYSIIQMKNLQRRNSETCVTQAGYSTVAVTCSKMGSRTSLDPLNEGHGSPSHSVAKSENEGLIEKNDVHL